MILNLPSEINQIMRQKQEGEKLDRLFSLTYVLMEKDSWNNTLPHSDLKRLFDMLPLTVKSLMKKSDDDLGISDEYSRNGINKLMLSFIQLRNKLL